MAPALYGELASWYRLIDPPSDHLDEATAYRDAFERAISPPPETLLELGCGGGHNASYLRQRFRCTLTDRSEPMLALSRALNPECEHLVGDMRTLRLGRTFDAVLLHDAVMYMTTLDDLRDAVRTAFEHTRVGGAALFAPDCVRETFREWTSLIQGKDGDRELRAIEWAWDPDPADETFQIEYGFLLRERGEVRAVHDRHVEGLFRRADWLDLLGGAGFAVELRKLHLEGGEVTEIFVCHRH